MRLKKLPVYLLAAGLALLVTVGVFILLPPQPVSAQCGSQASSCKNCHETQAKDSVNNDGTAWHTAHAFGDFCYLCHSGNNQATDETAAHTGMVDPLKDIVSACKSCHTADYQAKAQVYATTLGVTISSGAAAPTQAASASQPAASSTPAASAAPAAAPAASVPAANMVDYTQRYAETGLGQQPVNLGNLILIVMIAAMLLGGGYFVLSREHLIKVSFQETKQIEGSYPPDVVEMVPQIARLNNSARKDLRAILDKPGKAGEIFALATRLTSTPETPQEASEPNQEEPS